MWGTNFNYVACTINTRMAALGLPCKNRSRKQVKLKYNREEKANPKKVTRAVQGQVGPCVVLSSFCYKVGYILSWNIFLSVLTSNALWWEMGCSALIANVGFACGGMGSQLTCIVVHAARCTRGL